MSTAWRCKHAVLRERYEGGRFIKPSSSYNEDYHCKAKEFFARMFPPQIGCWVDECENFYCSQMAGYKGKCRRADGDKWCSMGMYFPARDYRNQCCTCHANIEDCPFFKARDKADYLQRVGFEELPFLKRDNTLRADAKTAVRAFGITEKEVEMVTKELIEIKERRRRRDD